MDIVIEALKLYWRREKTNKDIIEKVMKNRNTDLVEMPQAFTEIFMKIKTKLKNGIPS